MSLAKLKKDALAIFQAGVEAVNPVHAVKKHLRLVKKKLWAGEKTYDLAAYNAAYVIGAGKAAAAMAQPVEEILGSRLKDGVINVKYGHTLPLKTIRTFEAGHPVPDEAGLRGMREILELLNQTGEKDLVICLLSGGGSALMPCPAEGLTLEDIQQVTRQLLDCGAAIPEINAIRKHISRVTGGRLSQMAFPSSLISLILSDVIGDDLENIASGPTVPDRTTFSDGLQILEKYGISHKIPSAALAHIKKGVAGKIEETPKPGDPVFARTQNIIIGNNITAIEAAGQKAERLGYHTLILSSLIGGETREVAGVHAAVAREIARTGHPVPKPACVISGGETTITIRGQGLGGRNQEFALAAATAINGLENGLILSAGTDGIDGPTDAAGAVADGTTVERAVRSGMNPESYLRDNDSYHFFKRLDDLVITGPTYTNVMDLRLILVA
ncbi:MAG: glycerate kinase [Candidatus Aminicenantales bacterium]